MVSVPMIASVDGRRLARAPTLLPGYKNPPEQKTTLQEELPPTIGMTVIRGTEQLYRVIQTVCPTGIPAP